MSELKFTGTNLDEAIKNASEALNITSDNLKFDIVSLGSKGFLGLVGKKLAEIKVTVNDDKGRHDDKKQKESHHEKQKERHEKPKEHKHRERGQSEPRVEALPKESAHAVEIPVKEPAPKKPFEKETSEPKEKDSELQEKRHKENKERKERRERREQRDQKDSKDSKPKREKKKFPKKEDNAPNADEEQDTSAPIEDDPEKTKKIEDFVLYITKRLDDEVVVAAGIKKNKLVVTVTSKNSGKIIGKSGHVINSIEYLTTKYARNIYGEKTRVVLQIVDAE